MQTFTSASLATHLGRTIRDGVLAEAVVEAVRLAVGDQADLLIGLVAVLSLVALMGLWQRRRVRR